MVCVFTDSRCLRHQGPVGFPERPERLAGILPYLSPRWEVRSSQATTTNRESAVLAVHDTAYVARFQGAVKRGDGLLDSADNPLSPGTWESAWAAVETTLEAADWVAQGEGRMALAAVRPPGHHAERTLAMGFCFFNNVAVAAQHLLDQHGLDRLAIFDFDVHHGNGTQHIFEERGDVFYLSTHQYPFYPGTGAAGETGVGAGQGATLNVPLPAGTGDVAYLEALDERILPALRDYGPQILLVSAGFDAWRGDPLGGMEVSEAGYHQWGQRLAELAAQVTGGRVLAVLEGGYDLAALPKLVDAHLRGLGGDPE